jgi:hypothetical protein
MLGYVKPYDFFGPLFLLFRVASLFIERGFWTRWLTEFAQQRWAASFYLSELAKKLLRSHHPPILTTLPTHIPSFVVSMVLFLCWPFAQEAWMLCYGGCLIVEPFMRILFEQLLWSYGMSIWAFVLSYEGGKWAIRILAAFYSFGVSLWLIRVGAGDDKYWMIWLGGGILIAYGVGLWIDLRYAYTHRFIRWLWLQFLLDINKDNKGNKVDPVFGVEFDYMS